MRSASSPPPVRPVFIKANDFGHRLLIQERCPPPIPLQNPQEKDTQSIESSPAPPFQPTILDFHRIASPEPEIFPGSFSVEELFDTPGASPARLMEEHKKRLSEQGDHSGTDFSISEPDLRWVHLPFNSMKYAEDIIKMVSKDHHANEDFVDRCILREDMWMEKLHKKRRKDGYHANYMQPFCSEIICEETKHPKGAEDHCCHRGANMVLFVPYLHWGALDVLTWRDKQIPAIEEKCRDKRITAIEEKEISDNDISISETRKFYLELMRSQLCSKTKPLHMRRTLDQFYHTYKKDTSKRDHDQIVSKYGKGGPYWEPNESESEQNTPPITRQKRLRLMRGKKSGDEEEQPAATEITKEDDKRTILLVDQLWLWVLGGKTLITCFDRRWEEQYNPRSNVYDNVRWKLRQAGHAKHIKTPYDLANLIIDEASSFFFTSTDEHKDSPRFSELFHKAIGQADNEQIRLFDEFRNLGEYRAMDLSSKKQDMLFDVSEEFKLFREIRDILDELNMIHRVYKEQLRILPALRYAQQHYALFHDLKTNEFGQHKNACPGEDNTTATTCASTKSSRCMAKKEGVDPKYDCNSDWEPLPEINFDPRDWFKRTSEYMEEHHAEIVEMMDEASRVSNALRDTIDLKQNSASIFDAHASRREGEAIMLFTVLSSVFLPLGFFTSFFGMNVVEINQGSHYTLHTALAVTLPISFAIFAVAMLCAFTRSARTFITEVLTFDGSAREKLRQMLRLPRR